MTIFEVHFTAGETLLLEGADAYQPEGAMTTFFASGSSRSTIDSWSTRIASFRTADITSVQRLHRGVTEASVLDLTETGPGAQNGIEPAAVAAGSMIEGSVAA